MSRRYKIALQGQAVTSSNGLCSDRRKDVALPRKAVLVRVSGLNEAGANASYRLFASGFTNSRTDSMNICATGLSDRFFKVVMPTGCRGCRAVSRAVP